MTDSSISRVDTFPRVSPGARDRATLEQLRRVGRVPDVPASERDYRGCVVQKPWGFEFLAYDTPEVAVWRLRINAGHSTSMHCHPHKRTALLVLSGNALGHVFGRRFALKAHDVLVLEPGVFHATKAVSDDGLDLIEVETPRCKTDLVRLNDLYGREGAGYEGLRDMHTDRLERFEHFALSVAAHDDGCSGYVDPRQRFGLSIRSFDTASLHQWSFDPAARALVVLSGRLDGGAERSTADIGDALRPTEARTREPGAVTKLIGLTLEAPGTEASTTPVLAALKTGTYR